MGDKQTINYRNIRSSIEAKVVVAVLAGILISLSALGIFNYYNARKMLILDAEENLTHQADGYANEISAWRESSKLHVAALANSPVVIAGDKETSLAYLRNESKRNPIFLRFWLVDPDGQAIHTTGDRTNIVDRAYFKQVMSTGDIVVTDPVISKVDGKSVISVVAPIKRNDKIVGVLGGTVVTDSLIERLNGIKIADSGYAYLVQKNGLIISHPDKNVVMKQNLLSDQNANEPLKKLISQLVSGKKGLGIYEWSGKEKYIAYAPVPGSQWGLALSVPQNEVLVRLASFRIVSIATIVVILLLAGLAGLFAARRFTQPIVALNKRVEKIAQGDFTGAGATKNKFCGEQDELATLENNFDQMAGYLRGLVQEIATSAEQLAASSEELTANADQSAQAAGQVSQIICDLAGGADKTAAKVVSAANVTQHVTEQTNAANENVNSIVSTVEEAESAVTGGRQAVEYTIQQMSVIEKSVSDSAAQVERLGERSKEIGEIVDAISGIAGQTNLLALNAAIEAARAGEQGRGFAVVAEEVRKLAEQSEEAAKHIALLINEIQDETGLAVKSMSSGTSDVQKGTEVVGTAGEAFNQIATFIDRINAQIHVMSTSVQDVAKGSDELASVVQDIKTITTESAGQTQSVSAATEEQSASMEEIASSSQSLAKLATDLQAAVGHFKI